VLVGDIQESGGKAMRCEKIGEVGEGREERGDHKALKRGEVESNPGHTIGEMKASI